MDWDNKNGGGGCGEMSSTGDYGRKEMVMVGGERAVIGEDVMMGEVKVMTDEQMEMLRKQIAAYATICEQLVEMHKAMTANQEAISGIRMGHLYGESSITSGCQKITARQRWNPTQTQLEILESMFSQGNGTPTKQKIKEITLDLSQHGQISETNVYNWFQNRRARSKRKQVTSLPNNTDSGVKAEVESQQE